MNSIIRSLHPLAAMLLVGLGFGVPSARANPLYQATNLGTNTVFGLSSSGQVLEAYPDFGRTGGVRPLVYSGFGPNAGRQDPVPFDVAGGISANGTVGGLKGTWSYGNPGIYDANTPGSAPTIFPVQVPGDHAPFGSWPPLWTTAVNDSGQSVGTGYTLKPGYKWPGDPYAPQHAYTWNGNTATDLGALSGNASAPTAINNSGQIVGNSTMSNGDTHAFLYSNGVLKDLGGLPGLSYSTATAINDAGQVVGYSRTDYGAKPFQSEAFLYSDGRMTALGTVAGDAYAMAEAINSQGVIVGDSWGAGKPHPFVRLNGVMTDLNTLIPSTADFHLWDAYYINDAGQIVAYGIDSRGVLNSYLLTPSGMPAPVPPVLYGEEIPEPSTLTFTLLLGSVGAARWGFRRFGRSGKTAETENHGAC